MFDVRSEFFPNLGFHTASLGEGFEDDEVGEGGHECFLAVRKSADAVAESRHAPLRSVRAGEGPVANVLHAPQDSIVSAGEVVFRVKDPRVSRMPEAEVAEFFRLGVAVEKVVDGLFDAFGMLRVPSGHEGERGEGGANGVAAPRSVGTLVFDEIGNQILMKNVSCFVFAGIEVGKVHRAGNLQLKSLELSFSQDSKLDDVAHVFTSLGGGGGENRSSQSGFMAVMKPIPTGFQVIERERPAIDFDNPVTGFEPGFVCGESFADFHDREHGLGVFRHRGESERSGIELVGPESAIGATE